MDAAAHTPLHDALTARRAAIADRWYRAVAHSGFAPFSGREARARLLALTERAIATLLANPFVPEEARAIGTALADLHYLRPAALEGTLMVLGEDLAAGLPPAVLLTVQPRLATLLGGVAHGYYAAARAAILAEQEAARAPLLAEQQRVEAALRASEARLRAVVTNSPVMLFALNRDGVFTLAEGKGLAVLGLTPAAVVGQPVDTLFAAAPALAGEVRRTLAGEAGAAIVEIGGIVIEARHTPERDEAGAIIGAIGVATDITERTRAEAALRASEERLRAVVEGAPVILFTRDAVGVVTFVAGRGLAALGHAPGAIVGYPLFGDGPCPPAIGDYARRAFAGETVEGRVTVRNLVFATHYAPLRDEAGATVGVIGVATDVTARARAEAERDEARRLLAASREEERLRIAWELHDGPVQQLLGVRHHLAAIGRRLTRERLPDNVVPALAVIEGELVAVARELCGLIGTLRPVGLEERGLLGALAEHVARLRREDERIIPTITLTLDPAAGGLPLPVARTLLRVAQEAIRNTLRHADAGRVDVCLTVAADTAVLIVTDDGRGACMPTQLSALARAGHFGLAGLEEEILLSRGSFTVVSRPGVGTTVTALLPYTAPESISDRTR